MPNETNKLSVGVADAGGAGEAPDERILRFIGRHRVMTLAATAAEGDVWCCNLFYACIAPGKTFPGGALVFTSPEKTLHATYMTENPSVAGSIVLESKVVGKLQGLQLRGTVIRADKNPTLCETAKKAYLKRFPFAALILSDLWVLALSRLKYTDNTLGFGTKLHWPAEAGNTVR